MLKRVFLYFIVELFMIVPIFIATILARFFTKKIDVGIGPDPIVNVVYHKKALALLNYSVESFVDHTAYVTSDFDLVASKEYPFFPKYINRYILYIRAIFRYRILYIYFNGGPLGFYNTILWRIEPFLYKIAKVKVVVMPYGSDIQDFKTYPDLKFKNAIIKDYPNNTKYYMSKVSMKIDLWSRYADHVISGCDWVRYMHYWDTLMIAHFAIDLDSFKNEISQVTKEDDKPFKVVHASNHSAIKGTKFIIQAINELQKEGYNIELLLLENQSNTDVKKAIYKADLVVDQLIIGWYAMLAIEAMSLNKAVVTCIGDDLEELYISEELLTKDELPFFKSNTLSIKETLLYCMSNIDEVNKKANLGRAYVQKHHSLNAIGKKFDEINRKLI